MSKGFVKAGFWSLGLAQLALGIWMFFFPHSFHQTIGAFSAYNAHYERDVATFYFAFAAGAFAAARFPTWRIPVLAMTVVEYAIHTINHGIDVDHASNSWAGLLAVLSLGGTTVGLGVWLWLLVRQSE